MIKARAGDVAGMQSCIRSSFRGEEASPESISPDVLTAPWIPGSHLTVRPGMTLEKMGSSIFVHRNNTRIHHPANGQWRFGRLLCKGLRTRNKKTGKRCEPRALPFKGEREEPCIN
jgi:hypothetical protein